MNYSRRGYQQETVMKPLDKDFENIPEAMTELYTNTFLFKNKEEVSEDNKIVEENVELSHMNQKLSYKKEDCDLMYVGINNYKQMESWLEDHDRIMVFKEAIVFNKYKFENKIIYDNNSPYGLYGMFALKTSASLVITTCQKDFSEFVRTIYRDNGFSDDQFIIIEQDLSTIDMELLEHPKKDKLREILSNKRIDCILGEWQGSMLINSSSIASIIDTRDKYLNPESGFIFPNKGKLIINFVDDPKYYGERFNFWNDVYGFKMGNVKPIVMKEGCMDYGTSQIIKTYDNTFYDIGNYYNFYLVLYLYE